MLNPVPETGCVAHRFAGDIQKKPTCAFPHAHTAGGHKHNRTDAGSGCTQRVSVSFV